MENGNFKRTFAQTLRPFIELLEHQREYVTFSDWIQLVHRDHARVLMQPEQYLGKDLPSPKIIKQAVDEIFKELIDLELESSKTLASIL